MYSVIKNNSKLILIILIVIFAAVLRLYQLGSHPVSIYWDEAAIGYNAYSIAHTGADEYGRKWPLSFESFNDYKLPGYIYLDSVFVKAFGLSEFSVRLPSAISGVLAIVLIYLLTKKLFTMTDLKMEIPTVAALLLAISPWHIHLSRAAFETNIALTIILAGIYLLFQGISSKVAAVFAIPIMMLSFYFYYSSYTLVPLILLAFFFIYKKMISQNIKYYLTGFLIGVFIISPAVVQLLTEQGSKRVREVSIFENAAVGQDYVKAAAQTDNPVSKIFKNRRIPLVTESLRGYFSHVSPGFLFFGEDPNARHHPLFQGNFYIYLIPFLVSGFWFLVKLKDRRLKYFLAAWLLISPIPAALTLETPHSLRAYNLVLPLVISAALGVVFLLKNHIAKMTFAAIAIVFLGSYLYNYYIVYPLTSAQAWAYGYKPLFTQLAQLENNYDRVIVTGHFWKPYIYYLFYNKIGPTIYQVSPNQLSIGKYRFSIAGWDTGGKDLNEELIDSLKGDTTLLAISPEEFKALEDKSRFTQISQVSDYSQKDSVFLIGKWQ